MDRTAPTIFPLNLNHVLGTAAARLPLHGFSPTSGRLIRLPPATGYFSAAGLRYRRDAPSMGHAFLSSRSR
jgi:hypothetical protein